LFKKTLPRPSFLQLGVSMKVLKQRAIQALRRKRGKRDFRLNLIALALRGKKTSFDKVVKMVDDMVKLLTKEQNSDNEKKSYCVKSLDEGEDEIKGLEASIKDTDKELADHNEGIKVVDSEIDTITTGIEDLDKQVATATNQRKDEHAEYQDTMTNDGAAKQLLGMARNRLAKFYAPSLATDSTQQQLREESAVFASFGGSVESAPPEMVHGTNIVAALDQQSDNQDDDGTESDSHTSDSNAADSSTDDNNDAENSSSGSSTTDSGSADGESSDSKDAGSKDEDNTNEDTGSPGFLQIRSTARLRLRSKMFAAPPPPPETMGLYKKSSEESQGILRMLDVLIEDLDKGMKEAETTEKDDQREYEQFVKDSAKKRAGDSRVLSDKEGVKVDLQANILKLRQDRINKVGESAAKAEALKGLHSECDWLVKNFGVRRQARSDEIENLNSAKAVLSGADYP
jgi:flagellar motility protein MotE (MotC chaperone)